MIRYGSLFSGYGGLDLAVEDVLGASCAWHVENDRHASTVLAHHWPDQPNHGDITKVDWAGVEPVDVLCGGFPCVDISTAGRGAGINEGTRSGLWYRYVDAVRVLRPRLVVVENVGALLVRGLDIVLGSLAELGYDARWTCLRASDVGAPHRRKRVFLVAWPAADANHAALDGQRARSEPRCRSAGSAAVADLPRLEGSGLQGRPTHGSSSAAAVASHIGHERPGQPRGRGSGSEDRGHTAPDANGSSSEARNFRPGCGHARRSQPLDSRDEAWGPYAAAVHRWEQVTGHPAPAPTDDRGRLNPLLPEWMMGLDPGWVTDHLSRSAALRCIGNGVVPQQATAALTVLLTETAS